MTGDARTWVLDLLVVVVLALAAVGAVVADLPNPLRPLVVIPFVVVAPGYALVAMGFPGRRTPPASDAIKIRQAITGPESDARGLLFSVRIVLSVAASLAIVAGAALVDDVVVGGFDPLVITAGTAGLTVVCAVVALVRRYLLDPDQRGGVPPLSSLAAPMADDRFEWSPMSSRRSSSTLSLVTRGLLVVSLVAFVSSVGFAAVTTQTHDEQFSEFYLATQNDSGDYVATGYQDAMASGDPVYAAVENHEGSQTRYTVVVERQRISTSGNQTRVTSTEELARLDETVADNETGYVKYRPQSRQAGTRLVFFLYKGDAPSDPSRDSAYRTTQVVVPGGGSFDVTAGGFRG